MFLRICVWAIFLSSFVSCQKEEFENNTYVAYIPTSLRPGFPISISVSLTFLMENPVTVYATLSNDDDSVKISAEKVIVPGLSEVIEFSENIPVGFSGSKKFNMSIYGIDLTTDRRVFENSTTRMTFESKSFSVFIQTDKGIYQPGETIKFRAIVVKPDLLPFTDTVTYTVQDNKNNIVMRKTDAQLNQGVVGDEYTLPKRADGIFRIKFKVKNYEESVSVKVYEYKLPKFSLGITSDSFIHPKSTGLSVSIKARYTYGKPVQGNATVELYRRDWCGAKKSILRTFSAFTGDQSLFIPITEIGSTFGYNYRGTYISESTVILEATVTDRTSGDTFSESSNINLKNTHVKIESISPPRSIKPGLKYEAYLKVTQQDGKPLSEEDRSNMIVETTATIRYFLMQTYRDCRPNHCYYLDRSTPDTEKNYPYNGYKWPSSEKQLIVSEIGADGLVQVKLVSPNNNFTNINFQPAISGVPAQWGSSWSASRPVSPSDSYIQITAEDTDLQPGNMAELNIQANIPMQIFKIDILARGKLIQSEVWTLSTYFFPITSEMIPKVIVVVSYVVPGNHEIIADSLTLNVKATFKNQVSIQMSQTEVDAGNSVDVTVTSHPGSLVGLLAVDKSVLLLDEGHDITQDRIIQDLNEYDPTNSHNDWRSMWWPVPSSGQDATEVFHNSKIEVLTNNFLFSNRWVPSPYAFQEHGERVMAAPMMMDINESVVSATQERAAYGKQKVTRSEFPEAWIWTELKSNDNGLVTMTYDAPDTITTWELSSFAVSDEVGLGCTSENSKLKVFRSFFVQVSIPPKITRQEILIIKVSVFNYLEHDVAAEVSLTSSEWFELEIPNQSSNNGLIRTVIIQSNNAVTILYPIRFEKVGMAPIEVSATSALARDAVIRHINVKPEGILKTVIESKVIDRKDKTADSDSIILPINIPDNIVEGSQFVTLYAYGDILGSTMNNLGNLLRMPGGCGEQNMLSFAPDVFITSYLRNAGKLTDDLKTKAFGHIRSGYANQLTYKHTRRGGYSAFGDQDVRPSTWLTAFVVKSFLHAHKLDKNLVEMKEVTKALEYMFFHQDMETGVFEEKGRIIHTSMQGAVDSDITMTAYVLISIMENIYEILEENTDPRSLFNTRLNRAIDLSFQYLESQADSITDSYTLAIVSYAVSLGNSGKAENLLQRLETSAYTQGAMMYWSKTAVDPGCIGSNCDHKTVSSDVEMTSYALLAYLNSGKSISEAMPIVRWLVSQRNAFGGFYSTQDTVMAIQALSKVASLMSNRDNNLQISETGQSSPMFTINNDNNIVLQSNQIEAISNDVSLEASGEGFGIVQLAVSYNIRTKETENEPYVITTEVKEINTKSSSLKVCTQLNMEHPIPADKKNGMFLVTVDLANGFNIDLDASRLQNSGFKLMEVEGSTVNVYYNEVLNPPQCFTLKLEKFMEIARMKPQVVTAMNYYNPEYVSYREYVIPSLAAAGVCEVCGSKCKGCPGPAWGSWLPWENYCGTNKQTRTCKDSNGEISTECVGEYSRMAYQTPFKCPTISHGLYINANSQVNKDAERTLVKDECSTFLPGLPNTEWSGWPGTVLDEYTESLSCSFPGVDKIINSGKGFTMAFLVKPIDYPGDLTYTIVSYSNVETATITLSRPESSENLKLQVNYRQTAYTSVNIPVLETNTWQHVAISWDLENGARYYHNGELQGVSGSQRQESETIPSSDLDYHLVFRRGSILPVPDERSLDMAISSLDIWNESLDEAMVKRHADYYGEIMNQDNPFLSKAQVQHIVPKSIKGCFKKGMQSFDLQIPYEIATPFC